MIFKCPSLFREGNGRGAWGQDTVWWKWNCSILSMHQSTVGWQRKRRNSSIKDQITRSKQYLKHVRWWQNHWIGGGRQGSRLWSVYRVIEFADCPLNAGHMIETSQQFTTDVRFSSWKAYLHYSRHSRGLCRRTLRYYMMWTLRSYYVNVCWDT